MCPKLYRRTPSCEDTSVSATRLKAEGRWDAFKFRWAEYESGGERKQDARHMAVNDFPPLEESAESDGARGDSVVVDEVDLSTPDELRDSDWVWSNLGHRGLSRRDAPSQAAWSIFEDLTKDLVSRVKFRKEAWDRLSRQSLAVKVHEDDGRELIDLCERTMKGCLATAARDSSEEVAA